MIHRSSLCVPNVYYYRQTYITKRGFSIRDSHGIIIIIINVLREDTIVTLIHRRSTVHNLFLLVYEFEK
jgi:hypothetical protein